METDKKVSQQVVSEHSEVTPEKLTKKEKRDKRKRNKDFTPESTESRQCPRLETGPLSEVRVNLTVILKLASL